MVRVLGGRASSFSVPVPSSDGALPGGAFPLWGGHPGSGSRVFLRYLRERNVSEKTCRRARLHGCLAGRFAWRVILPVMDPLGEPDGFVARAVSPRRLPPYLNSTGLPRRRRLYNEPVLGVAGDQWLFVVEGPFDVLGIGLDCGVATLGKDASDEQMDRLETARRPLCVALDGDAWREGEWLARRLAIRRKQAVGWVRLPAGEDPGGLGKRLFSMPISVCQP